MKYLQSDSRKTLADISVCHLAILRQTVYTTGRKSDVQVDTPVKHTPNNYTHSKRTKDLQLASHT